MSEYKSVRTVKEFKQYMLEERPATTEQLKLTKMLAVRTIKVLPLILLSEVKTPSEKIMNRIDNFIYQGNQIIERMDELEPDVKLEKEKAQKNYAEYKATRRARKGK
ncbi:hypothetical protein MUDCAT_33 [Arthrobacter phage Mudcat]|uniref:Uncharacterized protein n=3 Tax=Mudcatvirus TaxID=1982088 RepID=A0A222Z714_9CAUD|nr:hypothetical protein BI184_gp33 [Arthrobacter phage Mudcat]YP_010666513.1 hypothetical protein PQB79_gp034 [Arthrobacter phage Heisenberger]YP_010666613.1 hypothetical protein PQB80_gp034 [Arthrobacter phage JEGGS]AMM44401.1 hypothetical protein MUDCAT_33 [Arthrobacter phage Mudcat]ASR80288.1 hypothetical protein SEA_HEISENBERGER_34 [Arthrobacter phage Heisenberger]QDM57517.1 hypothetical protein SEA_JEGGS_34 [Arthrobacter phage JEGGS]